MSYIAVGVNFVLCGCFGVIFCTQLRNIYNSKCAMSQNTCPIEMQNCLIPLINGSNQHITLVHCASLGCFMYSSCWAIARFMQTKFGVPTVDKKLANYICKV